MASELAESDHTYFVRRIPTRGARRLPGWRSSRLPAGLHALTPLGFEQSWKIFPAACGMGGLVGQALSPADRSRLPLGKYGANGALPAVSYL